MIDLRTIDLKEYNSILFGSKALKSYQNQL